MSLLDAILTESYRDPRSIHIALRKDGQRGRGTIDDPYDGGTRLGPAFRANLTCNRREFVVRTPAPHGLSPGATITDITGAKGSGANWYNLASATVQDVVSPIHFTLLASSVPPAPPDVQFSYKGPIQATIPGFSGRVSIQIYWPVAKVSTNQAHGPATYGAVRIDGIASPYAGDQIALGDPTRQNFWYRLAGLPDEDVIPGQTTPDHLDCSVTPIIHRFDEVMRSVPEYSVIRVGPGTFETRGTASIYVVGVGDDFSIVHVGFAMRAGYRLLGSGLGVTTVKLVMPIDELTQTMAIGFNTRPTTEYAEVADLTVDCNGRGHAAPYGTFPAPYTCGAVVLGGSFCRIRRVRAINFCTQGAAEGFPLGIHQAGAGNPAIVFPIIEDCILEKPGENNTHETTLTAIIGEVVGATAVSPITRHNYQNCEYSNGHSPELVAVAGLTVSAGVATLTTKRPHNRLVGQNVLIQNVRNLESPLSLHPLNDTFKITAITPPTQLQFSFTTTPIPSFAVDKAWVGPYFFGRGALSGTGCVNEGNAVHNCFAGCYQDTGSTRDVVFRDNYFSNISIGLDINFDPDGSVSEPFNALSLTRSIVDGKFIATFEVEVPVNTSPPQVRVGDAVIVDGARIGGLEAPAEPYNGTFTLVSVSSDNREFSYEMKTNPVDDADDPQVIGIPITFRSRSQVRRVVFENNICDFYRFDSGTVVPFPPTGVSVLAYLNGPPFMFPQAVLRTNVFRLIDGATAEAMANGANSAAVNLSSTGETLIEGNLVGLSDPALVRYHKKNQNITAFNNQALASGALPLVDVTDGAATKKGTLDGSVSDALLLSLL